MQDTIGSYNELIVYHRIQLYMAVPLYIQRFICMEGFGMIWSEPLIIYCFLYNYSFTGWSVEWVIKDHPNGGGGSQKEDTIWLTIPERDIKWAKIEEGESKWANVEEGDTNWVNI